MRKWLTSFLAGKPAGGGGVASATPLLDRVPADLRARAVEELKNLSAAPQVVAMASAGGGGGVGGGYRSAGARSRTSAGRGATTNKPARSVLTAKVQGNMRARCREAARNNGIVRGMMRRKCEHIGGDGYLVRVRTGHKAWDLAAQTYLAREIKRMRLWRVTQWVIRAWDTDGDALVMKVRGADGVCRLQSIEADLLVTPDEKGKPLVHDDGTVVVLPDEVGGGMISAGVETNKDGDVVAYHVAEWGDVQSLKEEAAKTKKAAVGNGFAWSATAGAYGIGTVKRIPADMVMFLTPESFGNPGQHRGEPLLQATLAMAELLGKYQESVAIASVMATCFGLIIASANPAAEKASDDVSLEDQSVSMAAAVAAGADPEIVLEAGLVKYVKNVGDVHQIDPKFPQIGTGDYIASTSRFMGAEHGLPPMLATFEMQGLTASNAKVTMSVAYRGFETPMRVLADDLWEEASRFVLGTAIARGEIDVPPAGADWVHGIVISTNFAPVMDLAAEADAWDTLVSRNFTSHDEACRQLGMGDGDEIAARRAEEIERDKDLGITPAELPGAKRPGEGSSEGNA